MKLSHIFEGFWSSSEKDPTIRNRGVEMDISQLTTGDNRTYSVYTGKRKIRSGITKDQATDMVNSKTLTAKFGKMTMMVEK